MSHHLPSSAFDIASPSLKEPTLDLSRHMPILDQLPRIGKDRHPLVFQPYLEQSEHEKDLFSTATQFLTPQHLQLGHVEWLVPRAYS